MTPGAGGVYLSVGSFILFGAVRAGPISEPGSSLTTHAVVHMLTNTHTAAGVHLHLKQRVHAPLAVIA